MLKKLSFVFVHVCHYVVKVQIVYDFYSLVMYSNVFNDKLK